MPEDTADIMGERIPVDPFGTAPEPGQHLHHQEKRLFEARQRWSLDVARRAVGGVVGREVKEREELGEALREIKSERLRGYAKAFSLINDREITGIDGRRRLLEEARRLRELTEEEVLEGKDYQLAEKLQQAISRRLSRFEEPIKPPTRAEMPTWKEVLPKTKEGWIKEVRGQLKRAMDGDIRIEGPWVQGLRFGEDLPEAFTMRDAFERMRRLQPEIANEEIEYEYGGKTRKKKFVEILQGEVEAMEALEKRYKVWDKIAPSIGEFEKILQVMQAEGETIDPGKYEKIATLIPHSGETEAVGDKVDIGVKAYRRIARRMPFDVTGISLEEAKRIKEQADREVKEKTKGIEDDRQKEATELAIRVRYGILANIFSDFVADEQLKAVRKEVTGLLGGDEYAEEIAFRLPRVWAEAAWGDDRANGPAAPIGDAVSQLTWFEKWRVKQIERKTGFEREAGPRNTLRNAYPKRLFAPFFRLIKYKNEYVSHRLDRGERLRDINMGDISGTKDPDEYFLVKLRHAVLLFQRLTDTVGEKIDLTGFRDFNKALENGIYDEILQIEEDPEDTREAQYWSEHKEELDKKVEEWRRRVAYNYIRGLKWALMPPQGGMSEEGFWEKVVLNAQNVQTITRDEGNRLAGGWVRKALAMLKGAGPR